ITRTPLAVPSSDVALLTTDPCGVSSSTSAASIAINNPGTGRITVNEQLLQIAGQANQASPITAPAARANGSAVNFSYNSAARGLGTVIPPHDFLITSPEAINIPDRIRVYQNSRNSEARGAIVPIAGNFSTTPSQTNLVYDSVRLRVYITNAGMNRIEVYDI